MEPQDDPEARIRALEQPLADTARATELGTTPYTAAAAPTCPRRCRRCRRRGAGLRRSIHAAGLRRPVGAAAAEVVGGNSVGDASRIGAVVFMVVAGGVGLVHREQVDARRSRIMPGVSIPSIPRSMPSMPSMANLRSRPTLPRRVDSSASPASAKPRRSRATTTT